MKFETPSNDPKKDSEKYAPAESGTILVPQAPTGAAYEILTKDGERERDKSFQAEKMNYPDDKHTGYRRSIR